jgi:hypothetical protein
MVAAARIGAGGHTQLMGRANCITRSGRGAHVGRFGAGHPDLEASFAAGNFANSVLLAIAVRGVAPIE